MPGTLPYRLLNGSGNPPDADKFMANFDYLASLIAGNMVLNAGFESWAGGISFSNPANAAALSDSWVNVKSGTSAPTVNVSREATIKDVGTYGLKADITGAGSGSPIWGASQQLLNYVRFSGRSLLLGGRVRCSTASKARLKVTDGVTIGYSPFHSGSGTFESLVLSVPFTVSATPTQLTVSLEVTADFTGQVYFDSAFLYDVPPQISTTTAAALAYLAVSDPAFAGYLSTAGGTMSGPIAMGSQKITSLANGTVASDAAAFGQIPTSVEWTSYTPTFQGFGTPTSVTAYYKQVGKTLHIWGQFVFGTTTAVEGRIGLPSGFTTHGSIPTSPTNQIFGTANYVSSSTTQFAITAKPSVTYVNIVAADATHNFGALLTGSAIFLSGNGFVFSAAIPLT